MKRILNGSQEIEYLTPKWAPKYAKIAPSRGEHDMKDYFQCSDSQSNTKNICKSVKINICKNTPK